MRKLAVCLSAVFWAVPTASADQTWEPAPQAARIASAARTATGYVAAITTPGDTPPPTTIGQCVPNGRWSDCPIRIDGRSTCTGTLRIRKQADRYVAWTPRLNCR